MSLVLPSTSTLVIFRIGTLYQVTGPIGQGGFGAVYRALNVKSGEAVAIKVNACTGEDTGTKAGRLQYEAAIYKHLRGIPGVPTVQFLGADHGIEFMVMDRVGPSLKNLHDICRGQFSMRTVCMLAEQLITLVEHVHERGIIIRDIKPSNIAMGRGVQAHRLYLLDFGLARNFIDPHTRTHIPCIEGISWKGTRHFSSINMDSLKEVSRRDDMESVGYTLLSLLNGTLPWMHLYAPDRHAQEQYILQMKAGAALRDFAERSGPEFTQYFKTIQDLSYTQRPDYDRLRRIFRHRMTKEGWRHDWKFDWTSPEAAPWGTLDPEEYVFDKALVRIPFVKTY